MNRTKIAALVGSALLICATESQAALTWTYGSGSNLGGAPGNTITSTSAGGITATASAWANTNGTTNYDGLNSDGTINPVEVTAINAYTLQTAYLGLYGGHLGVNNQDGSSTSGTGDYGDLFGNQPEHAIDNNQRYDSVLFSFTSAVNLTAMTTGYVACSTTGTSSCAANNPPDSDFTVWYYTGSSAPSLAGNTYGALGAGWHLLGSYNGDTVPNTNLITNSTGIYSSYWLIGAYNDTVGGYTAPGVTAGNDYFKISGLTGTPCTTNCGGTIGGGVPEPGTLFLMGAGLIGLVRTTRRRQVLAA